MVYPAQYEDPTAGSVLTLKVTCMGCGKVARREERVIIGRSIAIDPCACGHATFSVNYVVPE